MTLELTVTEAMAGRRLYTVLRREMMLSASLLKRIKWTGGLYVNGTPVHTRYTLACGDVVAVDLDAGEGESGLVPEEGPLEILFENGDLLAVNKPEGLIVHPSRARLTGTLANYAAGYLGSACHVVNRLDCDTSGVVLFAKNARAKTLAIRALREGGEKDYLAVVHGGPAAESGVIDLPIKRVSPAGMLRTVAEDGAPARTAYAVAAAGTLAGELVSLLSLRLLTGRTHQIRVHCLASGMPVLGDPQYRTEASAALSEKLGLTAQLLHAERLFLRWPDGGEAIEIAAPVRREPFAEIIHTISK